MWAAIVVGVAVVLPGRVQVLPAPQQVEEAGIRVVLKSPVTVYLAGGEAHNDDAHFAARELVAVLKKAGAEARLEVGAPVADATGWVFLGRPAGDRKLAALAEARGLRLSDNMAAEGYALSAAPSGVVLIAETPAGLFYGVQTLRQLVAGTRGGPELPGVRIHDWPNLHLRGIMHDTSRCQVPTFDTGKRLIDFCARYKLNFYGPYIEHTFAWEGHEDLWRGSGAWTAEQFLELARYARPRHVLVIPQFEAMGHQSNILTKERYKELAETQGWSFAPVVEGTYTLLDDLMGQMSRAFPFHAFFGIGCDEVYDMGQGRSKELMEKLGGKGPLFAYHIKRLTGILQRYGRRPMMWGDMMLNHPETLGMVPKEVIILDWHYGASERYPSVEKFRQAEYEVVVCPGLSSWVRIFPDYLNAFANVQNLIAEGQHKGALGAMTCNWGDWGAENLVDYNWLGWAWAAACSWGKAEEQDRERFLYDFCRSFYGMGSRRLAEAQWLLAEANRAFPWGENPVAYFHGDPFSAQMVQSWPSTSRAERLEELANRAEELLSQGTERARANQDTLVCLRHPIRRYRYVAHRLRGITEACSAYAAAVDAADDAARREAGLRRCLDLLQGLREELADCREEFRVLWLVANNPEGLEFDLRKFDGQLAAYDKRIAAVGEALRTGNLPPAESLELTSRSRRAGIPVTRGDVAAGGTWIGEDWPYRLPLRLEAGDVDRPIMPVMLQLNLGALVGEAVDAASVRAVIDGTAYQAQVVPLWTSEGIEPEAGVAFILPRPLAKGQTLEAELYWRPRSRAADQALEPMATDLKVTAEIARSEAAGGPRRLDEAAVRQASLEEASWDDAVVWIENSRMRIMLGSEGAHLYEWKVKALGERDITQPGTQGWAGFLDLNWVRETPFRLRPLAVGPVVAMIQATEEGGSEKGVTVYAGLPVVEMRLAEPTTWMWNYDKADNFAADSSTPGWARLADGTEAPVPKSGEQVHVTPGKGVRWGVKFRDDGLTLGLITPAADCNIRVGPGGSWGGVGIEQSAGTDWFVTYCDVTEGTWQAVAVLAEALRPDKALRAVVGALEKR